MRTLSLITAAICITLGGATVDNQLIRGSNVSLGPTKDGASFYLATEAENKTNVLLPTTLSAHGQRLKFEVISCKKTRDFFKPHRR